MPEKDLESPQPQSTQEVQDPMMPKKDIMETMKDEEGLHELLNPVIAKAKIEQDKLKLKEEQKIPMTEGEKKLLRGYSKVVDIALSEDTDENGKRKGWLKEASLNEQVEKYQKSHAQELSEQENVQLAKSEEDMDMEKSKKDIASIISELDTNSEILKININTNNINNLNPKQLLYLDSVLTEIMKIADKLNTAWDKLLAKFKIPEKNIRLLEMVEPQLMMV